jgi:hypothetical protein
MQDYLNDLAKAHLYEDRTFTNQGDGCKLEIVRNLVCNILSHLVYR